MCMLPGHLPVTLHRCAPACTPCAGRHLGHAPTRPALHLAPRGCGPACAQLPQSDQRVRARVGFEVRVRTGGGSAPARTSTLSTPGSQGGTSYGADSASARSASTAASRSAALPPGSPALGEVRVS